MVAACPLYPCSMRCWLVSMLREMREMYRRSRQYCTARVRAHPSSDSERSYCRLEIIIIIIIIIVIITVSMVTSWPCRPPPSAAPCPCAAACAR